MFLDSHAWINQRKALFSLGWWPCVWRFSKLCLWSLSHVEKAKKWYVYKYIHLSWSKSFFSLIWLWMKSRPSSTLSKERSHSPFMNENPVWWTYFISKEIWKACFSQNLGQKINQKEETPRPKGAALSNTISPIPFPKIPTWELNPRKSKRKSYKNPNSLGKPIKGILVWLCCYCPMDWNFPPSMISKPQQSSTLQISLFLEPAQNWDLWQKVGSFYSRVPSRFTGDSLEPEIEF